ncbi:SpoIIE family protein phosphatase [Nonomuraea dietziae]|uniref:SpoIIE family protein phosphatase n=1 Tax=Nonomuraea dietziae TaxID=65515 RepID=UPI003CD0BFDB
MGNLTLLNYGDPSPSRGRSVSLADPDAHAPPLGLVERPEPHEIVFGAGAQILLYTDGAIEARDRHAGSIHWPSVLSCSRTKTGEGVGSAETGPRRPWGRAVAR